MTGSKDMLSVLRSQVAETTIKISQLAARSLVMQKFIELALPKLTPAQCGEIQGALRQVLEDVMSVMDDVALPGAYHAAFLDKTNEMLRALEKRQADEP
ncbi:MULTISPECIES: hypothetical protein [unclassified Paraburkholderia]|uniref:hypothetical protein n=1 Tax=unclassified Paraburkholderia TaxID=2615204 RepID=UPI002AB7B3CF|nr:MULTISPECIES: hypothetical protein [unclassified Paraburkholderia]